VEIFFVQENFMAVVTIIIESFSAFSDGQKIIVALCGTNVKKISAPLPRFYTLAVNTILFLFIVFVSHKSVVLAPASIGLFNNYLDKYREPFEKAIFRRNFCPPCLIFVNGHYSFLSKCSMYYSII